MINIDRVDFDNISIEIILKNNIRIYVCKSDIKNKFSNFNKFNIVNENNEILNLNKLELKEYLHELTQIKTINFIEK